MGLAPKTVLSSVEGRSGLCTYLTSPDQTLKTNDTILYCEHNYPTRWWRVYVHIGLRRTILCSNILWMCSWYKADVYIWNLNIFNSGINFHGKNAMENKVRKNIHTGNKAHGTKHPSTKKKEKTKKIYKFIIIFL